MLKMIIVVVIMIIVLVNIILIVIIVMIVTRASRPRAATAMDFWWYSTDPMRNLLGWLRLGWLEIA